jgi:hypothetical protein
MGDSLTDDEINQINQNIKIEKNLLFHESLPPASGTGPHPDYISDYEYGDMLRYGTHLSNQKKKQVIIDKIKEIYPNLVTNNQPFLLKCTIDDLNNLLVKKIEEFRISKLTEEQIKLEKDQMEMSK